MATELPSIRREQGFGGSVACQGSRKERVEMREKTKVKQSKLEGFYDFSEALESRDALKKQILKNNDKQPREQQEKHADNEVADWMRNERARAEDRAEKKYRKKFEEWQRQLLGHENSNQGNEGSPSVQEMGPRATRQKLVAEVERLTRSLGYRAEERRAEQEKRALAEKHLEETLKVMEIWRGKACRREVKKRRLIEEQRKANEQLQRLNGALRAVGASSSGPTLEEVAEVLEQAQGSSKLRETDLAGQESAAVKIQAIARRRAAKKRTAAIRADREEDERFANVLGERPSTPAMHQASEKARREALREEYHRAMAAEADRLKKLEQDKAALCIQKAQRQKAAREKVRRRRVQILTEKANKEKVERRRLFQKAQAAEKRREQLEREEEERQRQKGLEEAERQRKAEESRFRQEKEKEEAIRRDVAGIRDSKELTAAEREEESEAQRLVAQLQEMRAQIEASKANAKAQVEAERARAAAEAEEEAERARAEAEFNKNLPYFFDEKPPVTLLAYDSVPEEGLEPEWFAKKQADRARASTAAPTVVSVCLEGDLIMNVEDEVAALRSSAKNALLKANQSGKLFQVMQARSQKKQDDVAAALQCSAKNALLKANRSGQLLQVTQKRSQKKQAAADPPAATNPEIRSAERDRTQVAADPPAATTPETRPAERDQTQVAADPPAAANPEAVSAEHAQTQASLSNQDQPVTRADRKPSGALGPALSSAPPMPLPGFYQSLPASSPYTCNPLYDGFCRRAPAGVVQKAL
eukprot:TRINITY_DN4337_c0_g3_i1.p1 TRINITY_DN4337_c0_g3~~TRINITY_DN4337_c0_g3_i1.p1  ORF type:complete len:762 (+),score=219.91 TRINITY_DN4337_c0_g3_i1:176-2461(+)